MLSLCHARRHHAGRGEVVLPEHQQGKFRIEFLSRPGLTYTIQFRDSLTSGTWQSFVANGSHSPTNTASAFEDDFTSNSSGSPSATGARFYRISYSSP
jgi:hypothetical protein